MMVHTPLLLQQISAFIVVPAGRIWQSHTKKKHSGLISVKMEAAILIAEVTALDYIVLDIEFNGRKFASDLPMEVIEIGAVRLNERLELVDEFTAFIKPVYFAKLNSFIQKKTGIPQQSIDTAERFPRVIGAFLQWLSRSESPLLVTWGGEDLKRIVLDTRMHKLDDAYWLSVNYFDLLKGFLRYRGLTNDVSVEAALQELGLSSEGSAHRALDDARMTADIFRTAFPHLDFSFTQKYKDMHSNAKERRLVKNAIRLLRSQKKEPTWEALVEHVFKDKVKLDNPKKVAELQAYFEVEAAKKPKPSAPKPRKEAASGSEAAPAQNAGSVTAPAQNAGSESPADIGGPDAISGETASNAIADNTGEQV
ncbi:3'-5' exonuclease [Paenibacillus sp. MY03]|uniref:3'-5' exonuclease n=1 Tax=Paenibacillus sp. MY03 TaxID=302980 RepID=UPI00211B0968|nr:3'-5' exonuclease [Paenibacillus sp. MY03]